MPLPVRRLVSVFQKSVEEFFPKSKYIVSTGYLFLGALFYYLLHSLASDQLLVACQLLAEGSSLSSVLSQCPRFVGLIGPGEGDRRSMA